MRNISAYIWGEKKIKGTTKTGQYNVTGYGCRNLQAVEKIC